MLQAMTQGCFANRVRVLNRAISALYDEALRPHGLRVSQMNVLAAVAVMGRPRPSQVGSALRLEKSTLSRNVDRMISRGWLEALPEEDGRSHGLSLTPQGRRLLVEIYPAWRRCQASVRRRLGGKGMKAVALMAREFQDPPPGTA
jgi:DNA-binding MarR family transcriptional regulator